MANQPDCDNCVFKQKFQDATKAANETQEYYHSQVQKVNMTLAKYTRKLEALESGQ